MSEISLLCGKICSGKTHFATEKARKENAHVLSVDELMLCMFDECQGREEHLNAERKCLDYLLLKAVELARINVSVVFDYSFGTHEERKYAEDFLKSKHAPFEWVFLNADVKPRKQRLNERNKTLEKSSKREYIITEDMMDYFDSFFEPPK